jgi:serine/threonine protein kinase
MSADNFLDTFFDRVVKASPREHADLDSTTLSKGVDSTPASSVVLTKKLPKKRPGDPAMPRPQPISIAPKVGDLSGRTIGKGKYLLSKKSGRSTSGRSSIYTAYRADKDGKPSGKELIIKMTPEQEFLAREAKNYDKVTSGLFRGRFVKKMDYLPELHEEPPYRGFSNQCALVMEAGKADLFEVMQKRGGRGLKGEAMRDAALAGAECLQAMHSSGLVWTDLKPENFVVMDDPSGDDSRAIPGIKGIDVESGVPRRSTPVSFTADASPPEFVRASYDKGEMQDTGNYKLDYSFDMWSYGMYLYRLATGERYFQGLTPAKILEKLANEDFEPDVSAIKDPQLADLIKKCLDENPKNRPNIVQVTLDPYFRGGR